MRKKKPKMGWFFDISSNMSVTYTETPEGANWGDYHHHDLQGPYRTFTEAKNAGLEELRLEVKMARRRFQEFDANKKGNRK